MTPDITRRKVTNLEDGKGMYRRRKGGALLALSRHHAIAFKNL
jgi:hypothetical protein